MFQVLWRRCEMLYSKILVLRRFLRLQETSEPNFSTKLPQTTPEEPHVLKTIKGCTPAPLQLISNFLVLKVWGHYKEVLQVKIKCLILTISEVAPRIGREDILICGEVILSVLAAIMLWKVGEGLTKHHPLVESVKNWIASPGAPNMLVDCTGCLTPFGGNFQEIFWLVKIKS